MLVLLLQLAATAGTPLTCDEVLLMLERGVPPPAVSRSILAPAAPPWTEERVRCLRDHDAPDTVIAAALTEPTPEAELARRHSMAKSELRHGYEQVPADSPDWPYALFQIARVHASTGKLKSALAAYREVADGPWDDQGDPERRVALEALADQARVEIAQLFLSVEARDRAISAAGEVDGDSPLAPRAKQLIERARGR